jgi:hypothetical protein
MDSSGPLFASRPDAEFFVFFESKASFMKAKSRFLGFIFIAIFCPLSALASPAEIPAAPRGVNKELAQTIASLFSVTVRDYFIASRWNQPNTANVVEFQALTPFKVWDQENLLRLNVPFRTESELGPGLSDVRLFDLLTFNTGFGFWGIGPVFNFGIYKGPETDTFQAGPALTLIYSKAHSFSFGLLSQNFFSEHVAFSALQPILVYQPGKLWTISIGELPLVYDWNKGHFAVFSIGLQLGVLVRAAEQPVRFFINPQYNTKSNTQLYHWTIASGITLPILPSSVFSEIEKPQQTPSH